MAKSYWQEVYIDSDDAKEAVKSWFSYMCEGMTPYKVELLCDIETDREKKIRAFMTDADGRRYQRQNIFYLAKADIDGAPVMTDTAKELLALAEEQRR